MICFAGLTRLLSSTYCQQFLKILGFIVGKKYWLYQKRRGRRIGISEHIFQLMNLPLPKILYFYGTFFKNLNFWLNYLFNVHNHFNFCQNSFNKMNLITICVSFKHIIPLSVENVAWSCKISVVFLAISMFWNEAEGKRIESCTKSTNWRLILMTMPKLLIYFIFTAKSFVFVISDCTLSFTQWRNVWWNQQEISRLKSEWVDNCWPQNLVQESRGESSTPVKLHMHRVRMKACAICIHLKNDETETINLDLLLSNE